MEPIQPARVRGKRGRALPLLLLGPACWACGPTQLEPHVLELRQARPEPGAKGVYLNEALELYFSAELDPASVHSQSARILTVDGEPARGRWEVSGRRLVFTPDPVLAADLSDGGYRPGATYRVELSGFPRPDGLRGIDGHPLGATLRWEFRVVSVAEKRSGFLFEDSSLERGLPVVLRTLEVPPSGPIVLEGEEPLDPSTLFGEDFLLRRQVLPGAGNERRDLTPIPLRARLAQNFDKRAPRSRGTTLVELLPEERLVSGASYVLQMSARARLRDFGGHPIPFFSPLGGAPASILVRETAAPLANVHFEPFLSTENRSPEIVPGVDGTAWWGDSGRVEVRLPAAVGDGRAGEVRLAGPIESRDLQAVRLRIPPGGQVELPDGSGLVVLRAQGSLRVEGKLLRRAPRTVSVTFSQGETFSAWLEHAIAQDLDATVLIAGGDLVVTGELDLLGPIVLVAGGRLRLTEDPRKLRAGQICTLSGGDLDAPTGSSRREFLDPTRHTTDWTTPLLLEIDLARDNRLVEPLIFAVRSGPIPREGQAARWRGPPGFDGHHGAGRYSVRFVGSIRGASPGERTERVVEDPVQLGDSPSLRLQVELTVQPGPSWDPPWLDYAEVSWDPLGQEDSR